MSFSYTGLFLRELGDPHGYSLSRIRVNADRNAAVHQLPYGLRRGINELPSEQMTVNAERHAKLLLRHVLRSLNTAPAAVFIKNIVLIAVVTFAVHSSVGKSSVIEDNAAAGFFQRGGDCAVGGLKAVRAEADELSVVVSV